MFYVSKRNKIPGRKIDRKPSRMKNIEHSSSGGKQRQAVEERKDHRVGATQDREDDRLVARWGQACLGPFVTPTATTTKHESADGIKEMHFSQL